jgi:hypothetical protein
LKGIIQLLFLLLLSQRLFVGLVTCTLLLQLHQSRLFTGAMIGDLGVLSRNPAQDQRDRNENITAKESLCMRANQGSVIFTLNAKPSLVVRANESQFMNVVVILFIQSA